MLNQAKVIDKKRLRNKMAEMKVPDYLAVKKAFHELYCL
jgi:hypothetical protein